MTAEQIPSSDEDNVMQSKAWEKADKILGWDYFVKKTHFRFLLNEIGFYRDACPIFHNVPTSLGPLFYLLLLRGFTNIFVR